MTLLSALQKINVLPESMIATREGEMILDDEILKDGDEIKLIAVISGGSCHCEERSSPALAFGASVRRSNLLSALRLLRHFIPRNTCPVCQCRRDRWLL